MHSITRYYANSAHAACAALLVLITVPARAATTLSDTPMFLTVNVPPNLVVTLDDSGSMRRGYVPEECGTANDCAVLDNRYEKSAVKNGMYYDPTVTYPLAKKADGTSYSTSFTAAYRNGFDTTSGTVNLATSYIPTAYLDVGSPTPINDLTAGGNATSQGFMGHFATDFRCGSSTTPGVCAYSLNNGSNWVSTTTSCPSTSSTASVRHASCRGTEGNANGFLPAPMPAYYYRFDSSNTNCTSTVSAQKTDNDCFDLVIVDASSGPGGTDERQNFANWYSFWRTRNLATASAASLSFVTLDPTIRVAWQALNSCNNAGSGLVDADCDGWKNNFSGVSNRIRPFTGTHKTNFFNWIAQLPTHGLTPLPAALKRAGDYYTTSGDDSPYDNNLAPSTPGSGEHSCRRNYHLMMTDGMWTTAVSSTKPDESTQTLPAPSPKDSTITTYTPRAPFRDRTNGNHWTNTLSDLAFEYWVTDLRSTLPNNIKGSFRNISGNAAQQTWNPQNDPATWQHMVNFNIGLGLSGFLAASGLTWTGDMWAGSYIQIRNDTLDWPEPSASYDDQDNVADLWHAAINSRGQFFSADNPAALADAFQAALTSLSQNPGSAAALSTNSTSFQPNSTLVYQAKFAEGWSGQLLAFLVSTGGRVEASPKWDASTRIPAHNLRKIFTHNGTAGSQFTSTACSSSAFDAGQQLALNTSAVGIVDGKCVQRVDYLRGDRSSEALNGGTFRDRQSVMGDIINSDPAYAKSYDFGFSQLPIGTPGQASYNTYLSSGAPSTRVPMLYVGANDGRLYAIRADIDQAASGVEQFAYIPRGVFNNLSLLTDPTYTHHYYVDGGVSISDAYIGATPPTADWKTVAVGGLNAGGKTIYALDITDPTAFSAADVMWEYSEPDLGFTFSQPQIGILESGQWVAVFGNGYNSVSGGAILYIVDLQTGALLSKIVASDIAGDESNGLSTPLLYDSDGDYLIDTVYAGDLKGNMWKFNVSAPSPASWAVAFSGAPLITARSPSGTDQPITSQPTAGQHSLGGTLVYFGTGRYVNVSDVTNTDVQTFYGVRDQGSSPIASANRSQIDAQLQVQTILSEVSVGNGLRGRTISNTSVDYSAKHGFYLDLVTPPGVTPSGALGERLISKPLHPRAASDRVIFVTMTPSSDPCVPGGISWLMELGAESGGALPQKILDTNGDGIVDGSDIYAQGLSDPTLGISKTTAWLEGCDPARSSTACKYWTGTGDKISTIVNDIPVPSGTVTRRSWIQIR